MYGNIVLGTPRFQQFERLPCMNIEIDHRTTERHIHPSLDAASHFAVRTLLEADAIGAFQENDHDIVNATLNGTVANRHRIGTRGVELVCTRI